jgi:elongation factor Ts
VHAHCCDRAFASFGECFRSTAEERRILLGSEDMANKPDEIKNKIVDGRIDKFIKERALLEQEYVKDPAMTVEGRLKACISKVGENMKVEHFARFELGS